MPPRDIVETLNRVFFTSLDLITLCVTRWRAIYLKLNNNFLSSRVEDE